MKKSDIIAEYNKAEIHYAAMKALMKATGITPDEPTPEPEPTPSPAPTPTPEPTPTSPGIVYKGEKEITLKQGESKVLEIWYNGVSSTAEYVVMPNLSSMAYSIKAIPTATGYKDEITVKGISGGSIKTYIKADPTNVLEIIIRVR